MMGARDLERTAVYAAELAAFDGTDLESVRGLDRLTLVVDDLVAGKWWPGPSVSLRAARADARSSSARCGGGIDGVTIRLAANQATLATVAHELAHALAGPAAGHDGLFRAAYLDVVAVMTNLESTDRRGLLHVEQLRVAFAAAGLSVGRRRWPPPPDSTSGAIAL
jgi:hypothetical protein